MLEQPALYYIMCLGVQVFVTSDLGVAPCTLWDSCATTRAPVFSDTTGCSGVLLVFRGNGALLARNCHLFHILCITYMSEAIQNHQDVPLCLCKQATQKLKLLFIMLMLLAALRDGEC